MFNNAEKEELKRIINKYVEEGLCTRPIHPDEVMQEVSLFKQAEGSMEAESTVLPLDRLTGTSLKRDAIPQAITHRISKSCRRLNHPASQLHLSVNRHDNCSAIVGFCTCRCFASAHATFGGLDNLRACQALGAGSTVLAPLLLVRTKFEQLANNWPILN
jgi:hypothetical protein